MSRILDFILGIFTFDDPIASMAFYLALILIPAVTWFLGKNMPQAGSKIIGWVMRGVAVVLGVVGFIFLFIIGGSSESVNFEESTKIDGKEVSSVMVRSNPVPLTVSEGNFYEPKNVSDQSTADESIKNEPDKYAMIDGKFMEKVQAPEGGSVTQVTFEDGTSKTVVDGSHWDQDTVGTAIQLSIIVVFICFGLMLGYGLTAIIENPKRAKNPLIVLGGLIVVFLIGYQIQGSFFSDLDPAFVEKMKGNGEIVTQADQADAGGGIVITGIMIVLAVLAIAGFSIVNVVKMRK